MVDKYADQVAWEIIERIYKIARRHNRIHDYEIDDLFVEYELCPECYSELVTETDYQTVEPGAPGEYVDTGIVCPDCKWKRAIG